VYTIVYSIDFLLGFMRPPRQECLSGLLLWGVPGRLSCDGDYIVLFYGKGTSKEEKKEKGKTSRDYTAYCPGPLYLPCTKYTVASNLTYQEVYAYM